jgi:4-hydroxy-3-polyprenylbenzoate decarboxylase
VSSDRAPVVVGVSGATGVVYAVRLLELMKVAGVPTELVMTGASLLTLRLETNHDSSYLKGLATTAHQVKDVGATIASGSYKTSGMIVIPCSMKTLSAIVNSFSNNLLVRAADVTLKEGRRLVLVPRETPLHRGHLRLMLNASEMGAVIFPPVPAWYAHPETVDDIVTQTAARVLDVFGIDPPRVKRWEGTLRRIREKEDAATPASSDEGDFLGAPDDDDDSGELVWPPP